MRRIDSGRWRGLLTLSNSSRAASSSGKQVASTLSSFSFSFSFSFFFVSMVQMAMADSASVSPSLSSFRASRYCLEVRLPCRSSRLKPPARWPRTSAKRSHSRFAQTRPLLGGSWSSATALLKLRCDCASVWKGMSRPRMAPNQVRMSKARTDDSGGRNRVPPAASLKWFSTCSASRVDQVR